MADVYYLQEKSCPICENKFLVRRVRGSYCRPIKTESDFHVEYQDVNPSVYTIWVCPRCFYAASENNFEEKITPKEKDALAKELFAAAQTAKEPDFADVRTKETGIRSYELALKCAEIRKAPHSQLAGLYLKMAWLYRELKDQDKEFKVLNEAIKHYLEAFSRENAPYGKLSYFGLCYLIGELYRRVGNYKDAVAWFGRVVMDRESSRDPKILQKAREQWDVAKDEMAKLKKETEQLT